MLLKFLTFLFLLGLIGCATVKPPESTTNTQSTYPSHTTGIKHVVQNGQTLWRISKLYNVDIDTIAKINKITDSTSIASGQTLTIPGISSKSQSIATNFSSQNNIDFIWPIKGKLLAYFKQKINGTVNKGINIAADPNQNVLACASGKIIFVGPLIGYGQTVIIDHGDDISSVICGNSEVAVHIGDEVKQGAILSRTGLLPRNKEETLHFEIRKKHKPQNPLYFLNQ